jgi:dissimilatory sulfite reductase (desulfoviridin) alpha/beta subunit
MVDLINRLGEEKVKEALTRNLQPGLAVEPIKCETRLAEEERGKVIVRVRATCGEITAKQLRKIADLAEKYGRGFVHLVVRGSPEIPCVDKKHLEDIREELQEVGMTMLDRGVDNLQSCYGNYCTESNADPQSLLRRIERLTGELDLNDLSIKVSAGGCPNSCAIAHLSDIGFYGVVEPGVEAAKCSGCGLCVPVCKRKAIEVRNGAATINEEQCRHCGQCITVCPFDAIVEKGKGFAALVGGRECEDTRLGEVIAEFLSEEEALNLTERCLRILKEKKVSTATIIDEIGIEKLKELLVPGTKLSGYTS